MTFPHTGAGGWGLAARAEADRARRKDKRRPYECGEHRQPNHTLVTDDTGDEVRSGDSRALAQASRHSSDGAAERGFGGKEAQRRYAAWQGMSEALLKSAILTQKETLTAKNSSASGGLFVDMKSVWTGRPRYRPGSS